MSLIHLKVNILICLMDLNMQNKLEKWLFSTSNRDNFFITNDGVPCFIHNILLMNNNITFVCEKFLTVYESFMFPISATKS